MQLPIKSGLSISYLHQDHSFNQNLRALVDLSQWRIWDIAAALIKVLDGVTSTAKQQMASNDEQFASVDMVQSQLFVLRLLATCMAHHWHMHNRAMNPYHDSDDRRHPPRAIRPGPGGIAALDVPSPPASPNPNRLHTASPAYADQGPTFDMAPLGRSLSLRSNAPAGSPGTSGSPSSAAAAAVAVAAAAGGRTPVAAAHDPHPLAIGGGPGSPGHPHGYASSSSAPTTPGGPGALPTPLLVLHDPPPLDEALAKYILAAISRFFHTSAASINAETISHSFASEFTAFNTLGLSTPNSNVAGYFLGGDHARGLFSPASNATYLVELQRAAGRVLFYLTSSNWFVVFARIKQKLQIIGQKGVREMDEAGIQSTELTELRFLEWSNLNRTRLGMVVSEVTMSLRTFSKQAQFLLAIVLRRAIWNWIETHPLEFNTLYASQKRVEGTPDVLFDTLTGLCENSSRRKSLFWPTQTMLLVLCPDILYALSLPKSSGTTPPSPAPIVPHNVVQKKQQWLDGVRKALKGGKLGDVASLCFVDLFRACSYVGRVEGACLRGVVGGVEAELKDKLFGPVLALGPGGGSGVATPASGLGGAGALLAGVGGAVGGAGGPFGGGGGGMLGGNGGASQFDEYEMDLKMTTDALTALYKMNPWATLKGLVAGMLDPAAPLVFKVVFVRSCYDVVTEENGVPGKPGIDASLAGPLRALFAESLNREVRIDMSRKVRRNATDETAEKIEIVIHILKIWIKCPLLVIARDTTIVGLEDLRVAFLSITSCLQDPIIDIRNLAAECLRVVLSADFIPHWDGTTPDWRQQPGPPLESAMFVFWKTTSQVLLVLSKQLLEARTDYPGSSSGGSGAGSASAASAAAAAQLKATLQLVRSLLTYRNDYLRARPNFASSGLSVPEKSSASVALEVALLVLLCSSDTEVTTMSISCLGLLVDEVELTGEASYFDLDLYANMDGETIEGVTNQGVAGIVAGVGSPTSPVPSSVLPNRANQLMGGAGGVLGPSTSLSSVSSDTGTYGYQSSVVESLSVYRELRGLLGTGAILTGQKALQKRIRKILRKLERPTAGNMGAWEEIYRRWRVLSQTVGVVRAPQGGNMSSADFFEDKGDWQNYTGFLCALGGVCLQASTMFGAQQQNQQQSQREALMEDLAELNGMPSTTPQVPNQLKSSYVNAMVIVERFITELINLLVCDNVVVREAVKEFLGNELNERLFDILLTHYENIVARFLHSNEVVGIERNVLFVESAITVLKMILERTEGSSHLGDFTISGSVDFGSLVVAMIQFLNRLSFGYGVPQTTTWRITVKMCQFIEVMVGKRDLIAMRQDIRVRNSLMECLLDWNSRAQQMQLAIEGDVSQAKNSKILRDLDIGSMKAMVAVLSGLPLQPASEAIAAVSAGFGATDDSDVYDAANEAKGKLFCKYLDFFLKVLQKCKSIEDMEARNLLDPQMLAARSKENMQHLNTLKEYTIVALSNLLSANIDIGLKYSLSMGYHEDLKTRAAFMQVLTNLLEGGAAEQFANLGEEGLATRSRYERLLDLVVQDDLSIALALSDVAEFEEVASTLMSIFDARGQTQRLLTALIENEVERTDYASNIFRRNSVATRLLTVFCKAKGHDFLVTTLRPVLEELLSFNPPLTFEIDPVKMSERDDSTTNHKNLKMLVKRLLDAITSNHERVPAPIRDVCATISSIVGRRFPEARVTSVGAVLFLRFICPVIVAPEGHDIVPPIQSKEVRRGLVLATKVIQNLANNVLFGAKEAFMTELNELLRKNIARVHAFLRNVSTSAQTSGSETKLKISIEAAINPTNTAEYDGVTVSEYDFMRLHRLLAMNLDKIEGSTAVSSTGGKPSTESPSIPASSLVKKKAFQELSTLLAQLGPAPEPARLRLALISKESGRKDRYGPFTAMTTGLATEDFMLRIQKRPGADKALEVLRERNIFYGKGLSKERLPVLYYIARRVQPHSIDMELLLFHIITVLRSLPNVPFDLVIDASMFTVNNEWELTWVRWLEELVPAPLQGMLKNVYVYNCNSVFRKFVSTAVPLLDLSGRIRTVFTSNTAELAMFIPPSELGLPDSTLALERDITNVFSPLNKINENRTQTPVILKVSYDCIHVTCVDRVEVAGLPAIVTDSYRFFDIEDVIPVGDEGEFMIKYTEKSTLGYSGNGAAKAIGTSLNSLLFVSPKREAIITSIRVAKSRFKKSRPGQVIADQRTLRAGDVPGTLLNMAMLNLGSGDPNLRLVSYNLLDSIGKSFRFDVGNQLLSAKGLCIPANNQSFVLAVSKHLAETEKDLTVEFLIEANMGFMKSSKELKLFCLEYMCPWLPNLAAFTKNAALLTRGPSPAPYSRSESEIDTNQENLGANPPAKLAWLLKQFIELTINEVEIFAAIQSKIWTELAKVEGMLPFILDAFLRVSIESGLGSQETEILANTIVTLASVDLSFVAGKIINRALRAIVGEPGANAGAGAPGYEQVTSLPRKSNWTEITVLVRYLLMLSFHDKLDVRRFLPEICHLIVLLVGLGRPLIRTSVHGIAVNVVHSLCTLEGADPATVQSLKQILAELSDPKVCVLFGLSGSGMVHEHVGFAMSKPGSGWSPSTSNSAFKFSSEALSGEILHEISPASLESIVILLAQVMSTGAGNPELGMDWKARWISLVVEVTFHYDLAIQPRTFVALGVLSREGSDEIILYQTLFALYAHLNLFDDGDCNMIVSIVQCLTNIAKGLGADTERNRDSLMSLTWIGISLIQIANPAIFAAAAILVDACIKVLDAAKAFQEAGLGETLMRARTPLQDATNELDRSFNVWFGADFSFAFGANLLRGLRHHLTRSQTMTLLNTLLEVSGRVPRDEGSGLPEEWIGRITDHSIGFIVPLLSSAEDVFELFRLGGVPQRSVSDAAAIADAQVKAYSRKVAAFFATNSVRVGGVQKYKPILSLFPPLSDEYRAMLMIGMTVVLLENVDSDSEMRFLYSFLAECAEAAPEVFSLVYESLVPRMQTVLSQSQTAETVEAIQHIFRSMMSMPRNSQQAPSALLSRRLSVSSGASSTGHSAVGLPTSPAPQMSFGGYGGYQIPIASSGTGAYGGGAPSISSRRSGSSGPRDSMMTNTIVGTDGSVTPTGGLSTPSGGVSAGLGGFPNPLAQNANAVAFLGELGFKGMPEMGSFALVPRARKINNARLVAVVVRMVFDAAGMLGGEMGASNSAGGPLPSVAESDSGRPSEGQSTPGI
ncbi:Ras GTPase activating protein ira2 [Phlyctochytrium bullatum]|nr:Ras GTPase activating protein ira2 [Phlyctochytrium bullatum]